MTLTQITEKGIKDGEIVNADINATAAIAGSKINPTFTSTVNVTNNLPEIFLTDSNSSNARARINANGGGLLLGADNDNAHADSSISFEIDGSNTMFIKHDGKIGIGTTTPDNTLHLVYSDSQTYNTDIRDAGLQIENNNGTDNTYAQLHFRTGNSDAYLRAIREGSNLTSLAFLTDNGGSTGDVGEAMRITSSGNIGIGTAAPGFKLDVAHNSNDTFRVNNTNETGHGSHDAKIVAGGSYYQNPTIVGREIKFRTFNTAATEGERVRIDKDGKVGIGVTAPSTTLHLDSTGTPTTIQIDSDTESSIDFNDHGGSAKRYKVGTNISSNDGQFEIKDMTANVERLRINSSGKILVRTDTGGDGSAGIRSKSAAALDGSSIDYSHSCYEAQLTHNAGSSAKKGALLSGWDGSIQATAIGQNYDGTGYNLSLATNEDTSDRPIERLRIERTGNVKVLDGNLVIGASGHGIDFSDTSDASGKTSELLDDYEEGTWTPTYFFNGTVASTQPSGRVGHYTKIGDRVFISCHISGAAVGTFSGYFQIGGLPFNNASGKYTALCGWVYAGFDDNHKIIFRTNPNADRIEVQYSGASVFTSQMNHTANYMIGGNYAA